MESHSYRRDIDGLRAIAILSVMMFHLGYLRNGYLGVDIFFVISGYLITGIIYKETLQQRFSLYQFYQRRVRRIFPLVLFINVIAVAIGLLVMLPDDLENLCQSVVATNFFSNNILQAVTTRNYWDVVNEFKPLLHTWTLGIEEQFYLAYPLIFLIFRKRIKSILPVLVVMTVISLFFFFSPNYNDFSKFYYIQFRFFELAIGGIGAILTYDKPIKIKFKIPFILIFPVIFFCGLGLPNPVRICITVFATFCLLISTCNSGKPSAFVLENNVAVTIGKISFSLYMWHQLLLAFARYFVFQTVTVIDSIMLIALVVVLSILSYLFIEQPFRHINRIKTKTLLWTTGTIFVITTCFSLFVYSRAGVLHDVPELEIATKNVQRGLHNKYNHRIYKLDKEFPATGKINILIIGNSFGRDWANVLLESKYKELINISYTSNPWTSSADIDERVLNAKCVFFTEFSKREFETFKQKHPIDTSRVWVIGPKNFGASNGIFYNKRNTLNYCNQRTAMVEGTLARNDSLEKEWGDRFVDLIHPLIDKNNMVPVFTNDCKFISEDCRHLTKGGAVYFSNVMEKRIRTIIDRP